MKLLQLSQNNKPLEEPRILKAGTDFDIITSTGNLLRITNSNPLECDTVCNLSDCYQSRPLFEIAQWCEFDLLEDSLDSEVRLLTVSTNKIATLDQMNETGVVLHNWWLNPTTQEIKNIGSIFLVENQRKHPKLLKKALELIN